MFFAVSKINFDIDTATGQDEKAIKSLCEKIRQKFKVSVMPYTSIREGEAVIVVAVLARTEERLNTLLDHISSVCEESGFGRVESEDTLMDHVDNISDEATAEDD